MGRPLAVGWDSEPYLSFHRVVADLGTKPRSIASPEGRMADTQWFLGTLRTESSMAQRKGRRKLWSRVVFEIVPEGAASTKMSL